jgi:ribosomal protein S21|tara:strand:- start:1225 stop:1416 length:192 start_codon:yes stop_codon:yes gene_type:complete
MLIVKVGKNNIEKAIKAMRYKVFKTKQVKTLREQQAFKKKSTRRKEQIHNAIYKENWKRENED